MPDLSSTVALVSGASRGVGRGVALALGEAGATVYVTGRTVGRRARGGVPGTIDVTASDVSRAGGRGVPVQTDHTRVEDVRALVRRIEADAGRLDVLVNAAWGGQAGGDVRPFWEEPLAAWDATVRAGVWSALLTTRFAAPLLTRARGLVVTVSFGDRGRYTGRLGADLTTAALERFAFGTARDFEPRGVTSVALSPGFVRTERTLAAFGASERRWARTPELEGSESPLYAGRAVASLAADPGVLEQTGRTLRVADLARRYGFTDVDGRRPESSGAL